MKNVVRCKIQGAWGLPTRSGISPGRTPGRAATPEVAMQSFVEVWWKLGRTSGTFTMAMDHLIVKAEVLNPRKHIVGLRNK